MSTAAAPENVPQPDAEQTVDGVPVATTDPVNAAILAVSEDRIQGFVEDPIGEIATLSGVDARTVRQRIAAMLKAGTIRRVRQTMLATNLAAGALVAWRIPESRLHAAFDWVHKNDPFTGHVVIRSTDAKIRGAKYRLWTTVKVPQGYSIEKHCQLLQNLIRAEGFKVMPAKKLFVLGVGHVRRRGLEVGSKSDELAAVTDTDPVLLSDKDWQVLVELKREFTPDEILAEHLWAGRAAKAGVSLEEFYAVARSLNERKVVGRFSTFLEHYKPNAAGERVTKFNALFHWAVPEGRQLDAGREVGRFHIMTHAYWREGGPEFGNVNVMGVAHGTDKELVLAHKKAIDEHLAGVGIEVSYTNVFWGGRSEIKPSEIAPQEYVQWVKQHGVHPDEMKL
jgi:DNA-binding Lrp family transcriptional regulator